MRSRAWCSGSRPAGPTAGGLSPAAPYAPAWSAPRAGGGRGEEGPGWGDVGRTRRLGLPVRVVLMQRVGPAHPGPLQVQLLGEEHRLVVTDDVLHRLDEPGVEPQGLAERGDSLAMGAAFPEGQAEVGSGDFLDQLLAEESQRHQAARLAGVLAELGDEDGEAS